MPQHGQLRLGRAQLHLRPIFARAEAQEVEDQRVDGFVGQGVLFLE